MLMAVLTFTLVTVLNIYKARLLQICDIPYKTSRASVAAALQNGFKKRYKRAVKALGCSSRKFWLQWKALRQR